MKKNLIFLLFLIFLSFNTFAQDATIREFQGDRIYGVIASGAIDVNIKMSHQTGVEVALNDDNSSKLTLELTEEGYVRVGYGSNSTTLFVGKNKRPKATITLDTLDYINLSGGAMLLSSGEFKTNDFQMSVRGSAYASFVKVNCSSATITTEDNAKVEECTFNVADKLTLKSYGSSNLTVKGTAGSANLVSSSTSSMNTLNLRSDKIEAVTSGASLIKAYVSDQANVSSSGVSVFKYTGQGKVTGKAKEL